MTTQEILAEANRIDMAEYAAYMDFPNYANEYPLGSAEHRAYDAAFEKEGEAFDRMMIRAEQMEQGGPQRF
jgi:hypothetical protein